MEYLINFYLESSLIPQQQVPNFLQDIRLKTVAVPFVFESKWLPPFIHIQAAYLLDHLGPNDIGHTIVDAHKG